MLSAFDLQQNPAAVDQHRVLAHSHRGRRGHRYALPSNYGHGMPVALREQMLGGTQSATRAAGAHVRRALSRLEELKARRFVVIGRDARIARSLAAVRQASAIQLSRADWQWLSQNADLEDQFE
jgi:hypothetical protein